MTVQTEIRPSRRRLPPAERERLIVEAAAAFFAEHGFRATTRALAAELGVTQALLYRYFPSKTALIERVYATFMLGGWDDSWDALLADHSRPLGKRLKQFYRAYTSRDGGRIRARLMMQAGLAGIDYARRYSFPLTAKILAPICAGLRAEAGLPSLAERPMTDRERELAMTLHGSITFLGIRRHIYNIDLPEDRGPLIDLRVDQFVAWAPAAIRGMATDA